MTDLAPPHLSLLHSFDYTPRTRLVFGQGTVDRLGELAQELPARKVLLVTDPGIVAAGHVERAHRALKSAGIEITVFDRVRENPTTRDVEACLEAVKPANIDAIVGLGGGSSLDTAKGCNFLLTNGGRMADYWGSGKATRPMLPMIAVPTTAGTGSECQSYALIADEATHQKMACGDPKAAPRIGVLDPELTISQPQHVTAATGIDAVAHAVETAVTNKRNEFSWLYSREAFRLTHAHLPEVLKTPENLQARGAMLLGASYGGMAIELSMLGAAHAAANPLTAHYGIMHGRAVGLMLLHVVKFNAQEASACQAYADLAAGAGLAGHNDPPERGFAALVEQLKLLLSKIGPPGSLAEANVPRSDISLLAREAAGQWTAQFNPRPVTEADFRSLYEAAFYEQH